jgi:HSP20 family protein
MTDTSSEKTQTQTPTGMPALARSLQEEMDRMVRAFSMPQMSWRSGDIPGDGALGLRVDIGETDDEIHVEADLPGVPEDAVEVTLEDDILRIRAEKSTSADRSDKTMRVVERSHGIFERAIRVPAGIDPETVRAGFDRGVLSVTLPKPAGAGSRAHRIAIGRPG